MSSHLRKQDRKQADLGALRCVCAAGGLEPSWTIRKVVWGPEARHPVLRLLLSSYKTFGTVGPIREPQEALIGALERGVVKHEGRIRREP